LYRHFVVIENKARSTDV